MSRPEDWEPEPGDAGRFTPDNEDDGRDGVVERGSRLKKSPTAFRTISEVADDLHIPQHVLRFWETRFPQVKPLKRGGGRRYYRPDDISLLRRISDLLYIQGYTIKGVQRLLREGDGTLSGDLPPPDVADRGDEPDATVTPPAARLDLGGVGETVDEELALAPPSELSADHASPEDVAALEGEVQQLRSLLGGVLGELLRLRERLSS